MDVLLQNGLRVVLIPDSHARTLGFSLHFRHSLVDEPAGKEGITHFLEHMFFRRMNGIPDVGLHTRMGDLGLTLHAATAADCLWFDGLVEPEHGPEALALLLDIFSDPQWKDTDRIAERKVIEKQIEYNGTPSFEKYCRACLETISTHPRTVMGKRASMRRITLADLETWRRRLIVPSNACLVVVGRIEEPLLREALRRFETIVPKTVSPMFPPRSSLAVDTPCIQLVPAAGFCEVYLSFLLPKERAIEAELLGLAFADGIGSRLSLALRNRTALTDQIEVRYPRHEDHVCLDLFFSTNPKDLLRAMRILFIELQRLRHGLSAQEQRAAARVARQRRLWLTSDPQEYSLDVGYRAFVALEHTWSVDDDIQAIENAKSEDLSDLIGTLLKPENLRMIIAHDPKACPRSKLHESILQEFHSMI